MFRLVRTRICEAEIEPLTELSMTHIVVSHLNNGWRAGQHVRIRIIGTGAGWRLVESHLLIIASNPGAEEGLVLMCQVAASWTK